MLFSMSDTESVLREADAGTYLLFKDFQSDKIYLSVRLSNRIQHHRITEMNHLFYLEKQPYPYLDSIIFYHRRHKLRGVRLKQQAQLSARAVKAFAQKIVAANGNLSAPPNLASVTPRTKTHLTSRNGSLTSLITSSSDSTTAKVLRL